MNQSDLTKLKTRFPISESTARRNSPDGVASGAELERPVRHEPVATQKGKRAYSGRYAVRVTSFRLRLLDDRNLADKFFVDALVYAGILHSDAPKHAKVEVTQIQVKDAAEERTEIVIEPMCDDPKCIFCAERPIEPPRPKE